MVEDEATTWTTLPPTLSLTESDSGKGCAEAPSSGLRGTHRCLGPCRSARGEATPPHPSTKVCARHSRLPSSGHSREVKLAWWEPLGALYPSSAYQSRMLSSAESGAPHPVNGPRGRLPPQVSPEHVGCIHRAGGIGDCYLVMRHLPAPAGPARMGASSCPLAHPGLRPMAGHLRRTQRRLLNPSPLLDNHREGRPHSSWARPIHDLRDFSWSSPHAYWGAPDHTHR